MTVLCLCGGKVELTLTYVPHSKHMWYLGECGKCGRLANARAEERADAIARKLLDDLEKQDKSSSELMDEVNKILRGKKPL